MLPIFAGKIFVKQVFVKVKRLLLLFACLVGTFLIVILIIIAFPQTIVTLHNSYIEKYVGVNINFSSSDISLLKEWRFGNVDISSKKGYTLSIEHMVLFPPFFSLGKGEINANCKAKNISFHKELPLLNSIFKLLSIQSIGDITFDSIEVNIALSRNKIEMNDLKALSKDIRVVGEGSVDTDDGLMNYSLKFLFSKDITDNLHNAIKISLLKPEDAYWMSLNIKASGNYKRPNLSLESDFLNLNIKGINLK